MFILGGIMSPSQSPIPIPRSDKITMEPPSSEKRNINLNSSLPPINENRRVPSSFIDGSPPNDSTSPNSKIKKKGKQMKLRGKFGQDSNN